MLFTIAESVRSQLNSRDRAVWECEIELLLAHRGQCAGFRQAISAGRENFIFELKRTSPSNKGTLVSLNVASAAQCLQNCGAAAISVLTEKNYFGGSLADLADAKRIVSLPLLRKDFIIDKIQIAEAKAFGADAILLIVALLPNGQLKDFLEYASSLRIDALVEIHDEAELGLAIDAGATIIGVNNRDLRTMKIDLTTGARLLQLIPDHCVRVAESGLRTRADVLMMRDSGANAFLIGTAVMRSADRETAIRELMGV